MKNNLIIIIIISVFFGLLSGVVGEILTRVYIFDDAYNLPFFTEINIADINKNNQNLVIRNPKKVVVEQNTKISEIANSSRKNIVGIFKKLENKIEKQENIEKFNIKNFYQINNELAQGLIITSDGWIITEYNISDAEKISTSTMEKYVIIDYNKKIYNIDKIISDDYSNYSYWHIRANDLPVKEFASKNSIKNGNIVVAVNWDGAIFVSNIIEIKDKNNKLIKSSEDFNSEIILSNTINKNFYGSYLFDLNNNLVGIINNDGKINFINNFLSCIDCLLKNKKIKHAYLGIKYIDLSSLKQNNIISNNKYNNGALIYSTDEKLTKLLKGDIIISINNIILDKNNSLSNIISSKTAGDEINVIYLRNKEKKSVKIKL